MSEDALRAEVVGKTRDGYFRGSGKTWTATHLPNGRSEFAYDGRTWSGHWTVRRRVFCSFGEERVPAGLAPGGCWSAVKLSANCYEYYLVYPGKDAGAGEGWTDTQWYARGWRREEPSTCSVSPSV
ncbi:MAG TPA: hypothetical protein VGF29_00980 [Hyphomicrobiaceae bacterium]|jgi:hypothetical protein